MKPLKLALISAAAMLAVAAPAAMSQAQPADASAVDANATVSPHGDWTLKQREDWLVSRLEKARDDGSLDRHEYDRVRHEMSDIRSDEDRMRDRHEGNQLTDNESAQLEARLDGVADQIHWLHEDSFRKPW